MSDLALTITGLIQEISIHLSTKDIRSLMLTCRKLLKAWKKTFGYKKLQQCVLTNHYFPSRTYLTSIPYADVHLGNRQIGYVTAYHDELNGLKVVNFFRNDEIKQPIKIGKLEKFLGCSFRISIIIYEHPGVEIISYCLSNHFNAIDQCKAVHSFCKFIL
jgi:hypothetical protein